MKIQHCIETLAAGGFGWLRKGFRRLASAVMLAAGVCMSPLQAQFVYDAGRDFSTNQYPNGPWSYGWWPANSQQFTLFTGLKRASELVGGGSPRIWHWYVADRQGQEAIYALGVSWNSTNKPQNLNNITLPPQGIHVHPGPNNEYSIIRWTSPFSGVAMITAAFEGMTLIRATTDAHVWHNGTALYDAAVNGFGVPSREAFQGTTAVLAGDTIDFGVGYGNGNNYHDSTLLQAAITLNPAGVVISLSQRSYDISEADATLFVEVLRYGPEHLDEAVTVDYTTVDGTANAGQDYVAVSGTLQFAAGETNKEIAITILNDAQNESEEQFRLVLSNASGGATLANTNVVIRIQDNDPGVRFATNEIAVSEGAGVVAVVVLRGDDLDLPFTVDYVTVDRTAHAEQDYVAASGTLHFASGETNKEIAIAVLNDAQNESEEQFRLVLSNASGGATLANTNVVIRIQDNDPGVRFATNEIAVSESAGLVTVVVLRGDDLHLPFTVDYATVDGTAQAGEDYVGASGTLHFAAGETNRQIAITILDDRLGEREDHFRLVLSNPTGGVSLGNTNVVIQILSDDPLTEPVTCYVNVANPNPVFPYTSWATAATNIQEAVDAAEAVDTVLVTNGVYRGHLDVNKALAVRSVNGAQFTIINGGGTNRCASLTDGASLSGFTLTNGAAPSGGGAYGGTLNNCVLTGNSASSGGGAYVSSLNNCTLTGNSASDYGGGACYATLNNCTLTRNSAQDGGGVYGCIVNNCIVYFNNATIDANHAVSTLDYCCTTPMPLAGKGNISSAPELASPSHLSVFSPCRGAGSAAYATGSDIDGDAWATPPSIGCDEYQVGAVTGPLTVSIAVTYTNVAVGYPVDLTALIAGRTTLSIWDFDDGLMALDQPHATHAWASPGDYVVVLWAFNESHPEGVTATVTIHVAAPVYYVAAASPNPVPPYASWATAARNIQDAVAAGREVGRLVLVSNGVYRTGSVEVNGLNRVALTNPVVLRSVNGPSVTLIEGEPVSTDDPEGIGIRCVYVGDGAIVSGFTLTNGGAAQFYNFVSGPGGGGAYCEPFGVLSNCVVTGNSTFLGTDDWFWIYGLDDGGGVYGGSLYNCTLTGNSAGSGGGVARSTLYNCTLAGNSAFSRGGGASGSTLYNCTLAGNSAGEGGGAYRSRLYDCSLADNAAAISDPNWSQSNGNGGGASDSTLVNSILTGNSAEAGGGVEGGTLYNCILKGNSARQGGGAAGGTLSNCRVIANTAQEGGGVFGVNLYNSIVTANAAREGGGAAGGTLCNSVVTRNTADEAGGVTGYWRQEKLGVSYHPALVKNSIVYYNEGVRNADYGDAVFEYSCTAPLPTNGVGNICVDPRFVDAAAGDYRLRPDSPCINAGFNGYDSGVTDLDGLPRIVSGTVDMGAHEYQGAGSAISYAWLQQYGLPTDGSEDATDPDGDGHTTWQEWRSQTNPTNALSVLRLLSAWPDGTNVTVSWQSVTGVDYFLERSTDLWANPPFIRLSPNIRGQSGTTSFTDTNAVGGGPFFYRVGVEE